MTAPQLFVFAISHFCEKARWALDYHRVGYRLRCVAPGLHMRIAKRYGLTRTSLPILATGDGVVSGSGQIIEWADTAAAGTSEPLTPDEARAECLAIEQRLDRIAGVHVRRGYYSEALVEHPGTVRPMLAHGLSWPEQLLFLATWRNVRGRMIQLMGLGVEPGRESIEAVGRELDWLDELLADGRRYLVADRFSRADITAASLLAPLVRPPQHPTYAGLQLPPRLAAQFEEWAERPSLAWVRGVYADHRRIYAG